MFRYPQHLKEGIFLALEYSLSYSAICIRIEIAIDFSTV